MSFVLHVIISCSLVINLSLSLQSTTTSYKRTYSLFAKKKNILQTEETFYNRVILPTFFPKAKQDEYEKTEDDIKRESLETKPWRDTKVKYLKYIYRPWKESYRERYLGAAYDHDCVYMYGIKENRILSDRYITISLSGCLSLSPLFLSLSISTHKTNYYVARIHV